MDSTVHTQGMCIFFMPASAKKSFFAAHKIIRASIPQSSLSLQEFCTDRNLVRSLLEFSIKAAFPSTTLESLVLELEVKRSQIFEQAST